MTSLWALWDQPEAPTKFNVFGSLKCVIVGAGSFNFCATEQLCGLRKSYCEEAKEQRLKTCKSFSLMPFKLWHPSLSNSQQVKSCWKDGTVRAWDQGLASAGTQQRSIGQTMQQVDVSDSRGGSSWPHDLRLIWRYLPRSIALSFTGANFQLSSSCGLRFGPGKGKSTVWFLVGETVQVCSFVPILIVVLSLTSTGYRQTCYLLPSFPYSAMLISSFTTSLLFRTQAVSMSASQEHTKHAIHPY